MRNVSVARIGRLPPPPPLVAMLLVALAVGSVPASAAAQNATATLSGVTVDTSGSLVPDVQLTLVNEATRFLRRATTDGEGRFVIPLLPPGSYSLRANRDGFTPSELRNIVLNVNDDVAVRVTLAVGGRDEEVHVVAETPRVSTSAAVSTVVDRHFLENVPLNGRSLQSLLTLVPGVTSTLNINGQRANANNFTIDGVSANFGVSITSFANNAYGFPSAEISGAAPALTASGTTSAIVSVDALQEFRIQTSSYQAEFGRQTGGQISLVTRSGSNVLHGSVFEYLRNDAFDANNWFANRAGLPQAALRQNLFGGTAGGPVWPDRSFFFVSYEGLRLRLPQVKNAELVAPRVRDLAHPDLRPLLQALPRPTAAETIDPLTGALSGRAPYTAVYSNRSSFDAWSLRVDHQVSRVQTFLRYSQTPSEDVSREALAFSQIERGLLLNQMATFGATATLGKGWLNELRVGYARTSARRRADLDDFDGAVPYGPEAIFPPFASPDTGAVQVCFFCSAVPSILRVGALVDRYQRQINVVDTLSYSKGAHQWKVGADYRWLGPIYTGIPYLQNRQFNTEADIVNGVVTLLSTSTSPRFEPRFTNLSLFVQHSWQATRRLTLNYGARWELNPAPTEAQGLEGFYVTGIERPETLRRLPAGERPYRTPYASIGPRVGAAYQLVNRPGREMVVRGHVGLSHDLGTGTSALGLAQPRTVGSWPNVPYPITPDQVMVPPSVVLSPPYTGVMTAFPADFRSPYTVQWNAAVERNLGASDSIWLAYVGAAGRSLLLMRRVGNMHPDFPLLAVVTNGGESAYQSLQAQFRRRLTKGIQALVSYTWSHAQDTISSEEEVIAYGTSGNGTLYGDADFDVRHNAAAAFTAAIPAPRQFGRAGAAILGGWSIDGVFHASSGRPFTPIARTSSDPAGFGIIWRPDQVPGVPLYLKDDTAPGGRRVNRSAFVAPPMGQQGNVGRNALRGLAAWQVDLSLHRALPLGPRLRAEARVDAFNVFNHPNFGTFNRSMSSATFGEATETLDQSIGGSLDPLYQIGGQRSLQFSLKIKF